MNRPEYTYYMDIECPECEHEFEVKTDSVNETCPNCKTLLEIEFDADNQYSEGTKVWYNVYKILKQDK